MSIIIGLTGPTGSGKSSASKICSLMGIKPVDCDKLSRIAVQKGSDGLAALVSVFGEEILNSDQTLDRKRLAKIAFSTHQNTELLNKTIFPFIKELVMNETQENKVLLDAPTLFESGLDSICFKTVAVLSDKEIRLKRIIQRDGLTHDEAVLRMSAGKSDDFYIKNADYIIYNNENEDTFIKEFSQILNQIIKSGEKL